jgi:hypothetical protein
MHLCDKVLEEKINQIAKGVKASSSSHDDDLTRSKLLELKPGTSRLA